MALEEFRLQHLAILNDGRPARLLEQNVRAVVRDTVARGHDGKRRKVVLEIVVEGVPDDDESPIERVKFSFHCKQVMPTQHTRGFVALASPNGIMKINAASDTEPNQRTLDEAIGADDDAVEDLSDEADEE